MRAVSTRVLPLPAPAKIRSGPSPCVTASCWGGLRPARRASISGGFGWSEDMENRVYRWVGTEADRALKRTGTRLTLRYTDRGHALRGRLRHARPAHIRA